MKRATLILAALVALTLAADADAKRGRKRQQAPDPIEVADPYCETYCQPVEWTLIEGTACDYVRATCIPEDEYGFPNCAWHTKSCD
jgi:hypothetical protein